MIDDESPLQFPTDVLVLIAEELQSRTLFRTCANLNETCRDVFAQTLPVLWKLVVFRNSGGNSDPERWSRLTKSAGAEYVEFLIDVDEANRRILPPSQALHQPPHNASALPGERCKAMLSFRDGMIGTEFYAYLQAGYRYGGNDAVELLNALTLLRDISCPKACVNRETPKNHLHLVPTSKHLSESSTPRLQSRFSNVGEINWIYQVRVDFQRALDVQSAVVHEMLLEIHRLWTPMYVRTTQPSSFLLYLRTEDDLAAALQGLATACRDSPQLMMNSSGFSLSYDQPMTLHRIRQLFENLTADFIRAFLLTGKTIYIQIIAQDQHSALTCVPPNKLQLQHLGTSLRLIDTFTFKEDGAIVNAEIGKTTYS
ncbi:hypothetical protein QFC22_005320 [Naganishia vaughanmartiniae]|uniref:Uncharacterized protein n=1 Tax=Naganishia vaughanmartiniae TaxID=1424756 RepID=A0ACC2WWT7_9TREE|nr:hypothetical protein QFC22_005320 [Naganishia vaughanmartiniae]